MKSYKIERIEGIGPVYASKLAAAGVTTTAQLLTAAGAAKGRKALAEATGLDAAQLLKWANMADLMRLKGVGEEFSELLEAAGVDTVKELKHRKADSLAAKLAETNAARKLCRRVPTAKECERWIAQAAELEPAISH